MVFQCIQTIILPVVLYGSETWCLTLREECRLRVFENRIQRRVFRPKMGENGEWRKVHNEELHSVYSLPNIFKVINSLWLKWTEHVARMEEFRSAFMILTDEPTGNRPLERPKCRREDNIRIDFKEMCQYKKCDVLGTGYKLLKNPPKFGIDPPVSINHRTNLVHSSPHWLKVQYVSLTKGRGSNSPHFHKFES